MYMNTVYMQNVSCRSIMYSIQKCIQNRIGYFTSLVNDYYCNESAG